MSHDLQSRLDRLRRKLERETDPEERADLEASIAAIEAQLRAEHAQVSIGADAQTGDVSIGDVAGGDQIGQQSNQSAGGKATVGAMIGGDVGGDVQTGGVRNQALIQFFFTAAGIAEPTDDQQELVAAYLARLVHRCDRLRLSGAVRRERREAGVPALTLSQVYVTLAADRWELVREAADADALVAELEAGDPDTVLPEATRRVVALQHEGEPALPMKRGGSPRVRLERPLLLTKCLPLGAEAQRVYAWEEAPCFRGFSPIGCDKPLFLV
jgi:hypothetical protein